MYAIKVDLNPKYTAERYCRFYPTLKIVDKKCYYELFETGDVDNNIIDKFRIRKEFFTPFQGYLDYVYGLVSVDNSSYLPELENILGGKINNINALIQDEVPKCLTVPKIWGIINTTPDSFSDGGLNNNLNDAFSTVEKMIEYGIDVLDIGGESTRPGSEEVSAQEEIDRVLPLIEKLVSSYKACSISIDTTKSEVAEAALKNGASIINDISGGIFDTKIFDTAIKYDAEISLMHILGKPKNMQHDPQYINVTLEVIAHLIRQTEIAKSKGVKKIIIDPGIGFGKTISHNYELLHRISEFSAIGLPVLIGVSRKNFIGKSLNLGITERDNATSMIEMYAAGKGVSHIRTHNYKLAAQLKQINKYINYPHD